MQYKKSALSGQKTRRHYVNAVHLPFTAVWKMIRVAETNGSCHHEVEEHFQLFVLKMYLTVGVTAVLKTVAQDALCMLHNH